MADKRPVTGASASWLSLGDGSFWAHSEEDREAVFADLLARPCPIFVPGSSGSANGFHAFVKHSDVVAASKDAHLFSSEPSVTTPEPPLWVRKAFGESMVNMSGVRHASLRQIVQRAFTPRRIKSIEVHMQKVARDIVDDVIRKQSTEFVSAVAAPLPTRVICDMLGVPQAQQDFVLSRVTESSAYIGVDKTHRPLMRLPGQNLRAMIRLHALARTIGRERRRRPTGDLISALVTANVDGKCLSGTQLGAFFSLLVVAGIETTRNAIAHGLKLLSDHPTQRALLLSDIDRHLPGAVEEILRYSTPIRQFRRRVTRRTYFNKHHVDADDRVVLLYAAANRDPRVFDNPDLFDINRETNRHVSFGGTGPHYCLGASLARQEMTVIFKELLTRLPNIHAAGEPDIVASSFENRIRRLDFTF